ncbi:hypothetical protein GCM10010420_37370 [Streptomyces glaucosporus]|uniref:Integral membrane protein n=1 Tax=Streptomyces glaucosporus TaxID=284044 RepID=A0ABN3IIN7_9ACTN
MTRTRNAGGGDLWGAGAFRVSVAALCVESVFLVEAYALWNLTQESPAPHDGPGSSLLLLPFLALCTLPALLVLTALVVLPAAALARRLGPAWWWTPAVAAAPASAAVLAAVLAAEPGVAGAAVLWTAVWAGTAVPAHLVRTAALPAGAGRPRWPAARTYGYGTLAVLLLIGTGGAARGTGLLDVYEPPLLPRERVAGTWTDGRGGVLRLAPDGTATADGLLDEDLDHDFGEVRCDASGTWSYEQGGRWDQEVAVDFDDCLVREWSVGGTDARPKLNHEHGDPDSPDWYVLTRR